MCGVFGFITRNGEGPDVTRLQRIALATQTRGMHAFGLAWLDADGQIHTFKKPGPAQNHLERLERVRDAVVVIGHCRFATHGSPADNRNNHPHPAGAGVIVHNGVVVNHAELAKHYGLRPATQCDSEVLGLLMARCPGTVTQRSIWATSHVNGDWAILGVWRKPARLLIARRGRPLHFGDTDGGFYFGSLANDLPGEVYEIEDGSTRVLAFNEGELSNEHTVTETTEQRNPERFEAGNPIVDTFDNVDDELLTAAEAVLDARHNGTENPKVWKRLRRAVRRARGE